MKLSRRGIIAGLLATGAAPAAAVEHKPDLPKPKFIKGQIMPRYRVMPDPRFAHWGPLSTPAVAVVEYEIYDGKKFVALNSDVGQQVIADLS